MENLKSFLSQKIIAVVGVSQSGGKYGNLVMSDLINKGYKIYGVNAKGGKVGDRELYPTLSAIPDKPDMVVFVVPPPVTEQVLKEVRMLGISRVWMQPGAESAKAIDYCTRHKISLIHNKCIMVQAGPNFLSRQKVHD